MDPEGRGPSLDEAVGVLGAQLGHLRGRFEADRRNTTQQLIQKDEEIDELRSQLRQIREYADRQRNQFERLRTSGLLWRAVAHIKMERLDAVNERYTEASNELEHRINMNRQLIRMLQESTNSADELRRTSTEDRERLESEKEELSQEVSQLRQTNTSLTSELASLRQDFASRQGIWDRIEATERQREQERSRMEGQMRLSDVMANALREENQQLQTRTAIIERQKYVLEEQVKAAREEALTLGIQVAAAETALRERNG
ncbi:trichohyalin-like [Pomacea canaliculata]|uniref:trichohyalin-like n=1 Tax=Pomacea canaliculata TaxID=400727 RepID=UPI000D730A8D|nr:trichohyalin-like [Pomacea canaliculata]